MGDTRNALAGALPGIDGTTSHWDEIAALGTGELVRRFRFSVGMFDPRVFELGDEHLDQAWLPEAGVGRWPIRVLLGHLADAELVWAARIRKTIAEPGSVLGDWDEDAPIDSGVYGGPGEGSPNGAAPPVGAFVAAVYTLRQWMGEWLVALNESCWSNTVLHPERGELTLRDLIMLNTWHVEHHAGYLNMKVEKLLGPRPAETCERGGGGCDKPGCSCAHNGG